MQSKFYGNFLKFEKQVIYRITSDFFYIFLDIPVKIRLVQSNVEKQEKCRNLIHAKVFPFFVRVRQNYDLLWENFITNQKQKK